MNCVTSNLNLRKMYFQNRKILFISNQNMKLKIALEGFKYINGNIY